MENNSTRCDRCGDVSNSAPELQCGRIDAPGAKPCTGTYRAQPSRKEIFALRALEHALGWSGYPRTAKLPSLEDFAERSKTARDSAGLADLLCGRAQAKAIRDALGKLKKAKAERSERR